MWNPFKSKPILLQRDADFIVATFKWLNTHFKIDGSRLVLPTREFFPQPLSSGKQAVDATFAAIKSHAGMSEWRCHLIEQEPDVETKMAPTLMVQDAPKSALGTFGVNEKEGVEISYNPALVKQPMAMVATLAHELAHYLTATAPQEQPGGWQNWEFVTDIAATFMGFGIFMANSALNFSQFHDVDAQGWQCSRNGYLTEAEHIYALAIFCLLHGIDKQEALPHLKSGLRPLFKKALKEIEVAGVVARLSI